MQKLKKGFGLIVISCVIGLLFAGGCNSPTVRTYEGNVIPLEDVAVLVTGPDTCPIFTVDNKFRDLKRQSGSEFHLTPGNHSVEVFYQTKGNFDSTYKIEKSSLVNNFYPGHVYAVYKSFHQVDNPQKYMNMEWTPHIKDLGDVVSYARQHPDYFCSSKNWKNLRRKNGLTRSFFDFLRLAKDPSPEQVEKF